MPYSITACTNLALKSAAVDMTMMSRSPSQAALTPLSEEKAGIDIIKSPFLESWRFSITFIRTMIAILQLQLLEVWVVAGWTEAGGRGEATEASWRTTNFPRNEFEIFSGSPFQYC